MSCQGAIVAEPTEELVENAVAGDRAALARLLEASGLELSRGLESCIGPQYRSLIEVDDILQVTFLEAFLRIRSFTPGKPGSFVAWLRRIAKNNLRDAIRGIEADKRPPPARRLLDPSSEESHVAFLERIPGTATTVSRAAARSELKQMVDEALRRLPCDYERVLRLYEMEGRSGPEVAALMGRSHSAVRMLLARARECLAEVLGAASRVL
jgi:RNA polymerase sigma-70 factor (ECF subfamily)